MGYPELTEKSGDGKERGKLNITRLLDEFTYRGRKAHTGLLYLQTVSSDALQHFDTIIYAIRISQEPTTQ